MNLQEHPEWSEIGRSPRWPPGATYILSIVVSLVFLFFLLGCTTTASAGGPPARYLALIDSRPYHLFERPQTSIDLFCQGHLTDWQVLGCSIDVRGGSCFIYIVEGLSPRERTDTIIHERAHCAGWPADHPN